MNNLKHGWQRTPAAVRKVCVLVAGIIVIIVGIILLPLPGPGWLIIFSGLALLSTEFPAAERVRQAIINRFKSAWSAVRSDKKDKARRP